MTNRVIGFSVDRGHVAVAIGALLVAGALYLNQSDWTGCAVAVYRDEDSGQDFWVEPETEAAETETEDN